MEMNDCCLTQLQIRNTLTADHKEDGAIKCTFSDEPIFILRHDLHVEYLQRKLHEARCEAEDAYDLG